MELACKGLDGLWIRVENLPLFFHARGISYSLKRNKTESYALSLVRACDQVVGGMKTTVQYYQVNRKQISFIKFILEAYDNMAVVTTLDPHQAIVQVTVAPGCERVIQRVLDAFSHDFDVTRTAWPAT